MPKAMNTISAFATLSIIALLAGCQSDPEQLTAMEAPSDPIQKMVFEQILEPEGLTDRSYPFDYGYADLNGDTEDEVFVLMQDPYFCGTGGCSAYLFNSSFEKINTFTVVKKPVLISHTDTNGWKSITVWSDGALRLLKYDGESYPSNASTQPIFNRDARKRRAHDLAIQSDLYLDGGYELTERTDLPIFTPIDQFRFQFKRESDPDSVFVVKVNTLTSDIFFSKE
ncbi:hypothetical protein [Vibrio breoganii]|uniref:hypothetical protein n=1 Tax=Vibrio breoganii TaxID=553239 RepID=UPI000C829BDA|nr:hypothetical protein [Vibrio breoganii]PMG94802.1 hypothetical protein BCU81_03420 [Vibrio breoganii]